MKSKPAFTLTISCISDDGTPADVDNFIVGKLYACSVTSTPTPIASTTWTVTGAAPFLGFHGTTAGSVYLPMTPASLLVNPLVVAFASAGVSQVTCEVVLDDGEVYPLNWTLTIYGPAATAAPSAPLQSVKIIGATERMMSYQEFNIREGIMVDFTVTSCGLGDDGEVGVVQVVTPSRWIQDHAGQVGTWNLNGQNALDIHSGPGITYSGSTPLVNAGVANLQFVDAPLVFYNIELIGAVSVGVDLRSGAFLPESFICWLMYKPNNGFWVPLGSFSWFWQAKARDEDYTPTDQDLPSALVFAPTTTFPVWTAWAQQGVYLNPSGEVMKGARATP